MEKINSLTIGNIAEATSLLKQLMGSGNDLHVDLSGLEDIDISGIQLLISFTKEVNLLNKQMEFRGDFKDSFKRSLNENLFNSSEIENGYQFTSFVGDIIRGNV